MTDRAAHLVDHVFPDVPVRQWVLTLPPRLRSLLAWDHTLCRAVVAVYLRAVLGWLRRQAKRRGVMDGRGGAVAIIPRFGAALNLNVHIHALVLDGCVRQMAVVARCSVRMCDRMQAAAPKGRFYPRLANRRSRMPEAGNRRSTSARTVVACSRRVSR